MDDKVLRNQILAALDWEPSVDSASIAVGVKDGVATLSGHVRTYVEKLKAEQVVRHVRGVRAIAEELEVRPLHTHTHADDEIAKRAVDMLSWDVLVPSESVQAKVQQGWVTLSGEVDWQYQRTATEDDVRKLSGVLGVTNLITIKPRVHTGDIKLRIEEALRRNALIEANGIHINVENGKVTLEGRVHTWYERDVLETAVWAAPGVNAVDDRVTVG
ncbi:MAG: BON domain-containing protein [Beijerinckiaceae bacterium]